MEKRNYVSEGNITLYRGRGSTCLADDLKPIAYPVRQKHWRLRRTKKTMHIWFQRLPDSEHYCKDSEAEGSLTGMTRTTKRAEIVRAGLTALHTRSQTKLKP